MAPVEVLHLTRHSSNFQVVTRDKTYRKQLQMQRIKEYFYGTTKGELSPYSSLVNFAEVAVRRVGEGNLPLLGRGSQISLTIFARNAGSVIRSPTRLRTPTARNTASKSRSKCCPITLHLSSVTRFYTGRKYDTNTRGRKRSSVGDKLGWVCLCQRSGRGQVEDDGFVAQPGESTKKVSYHGCIEMDGDLRV